ncbi:MAG: ABC transporter substrate-binding protein [Porticoccus sp.]|mgnify:CR=1 FL=1|jgi:TRAP-type mannitol/chloroaromatic compound transport system substrate-binding protein|nr:ABC transporter substrate-binding protein [Porticoccus sp.]|tara:strand:+ start:58 stop:1179 length:1122 start_codon:yes stop_codon:yes gene_type:complete
MYIKYFFKIVTVISFSIGLLTGCENSENKESSNQLDNDIQKKIYKWKMVTTWPKNLPGLGLAAENFSKIVEEMSDGRLLVRVYGAGQLVPALEVFDAVSQGTAEMGHGSAYYWKGKTQAAALFTTVPFGLNAQEMNSWLHYGGGIELWTELYEPFNLVPLAAGNTGVQMAGWFNREINSLGDLDGLKMRIPGIGGEVISHLGVETVNIPGGELYTAMQTGVIDATEWVGPYNDLALGFHQVAKYYYYPGWQEPGPTLELIVNKQSYDGLPKDLQVIIQVASRAINQDMLDEYTARNQKALDVLVNTHNVQLRRLPNVVLSELKIITNEVLSKMVQEDSTFKKIYESQDKFKDQIKKYHKISEQAYFKARELRD